MNAMNDMELDADIRAAFEALEAAVPDGYFDEFESKLQSRLEDSIMTDIAEASGTALTDSTPGEPNDATPEDNSGLHDIRALAAKTKERVSQRVAALEEPSEPAISSASLALKTISLPEPGKDFKVFAAGDSTKAAAAATAAHEDEGGLPAWIWAAMSAVAAAAIVFFLLRGGKRDDADRAATNQAPVSTQVQPSQTIEDTVVTPVKSADTGTAEGALPEQVTPPEFGQGPGPAVAMADKAPTTETRSGASAKASRSADNTSRTTSSSATKGTAATAAGAAEEKPAEKATTKKPDTLEDLLAEASSGSNGAGGANSGSTKSTANTESEPKKPSRTKLDGGDVKTAMSAVQGKTNACYTKYQQPGMVMIKFSVEPSGTVSSAKATGQFASTDTGSCVAEAVKTAQFPAYNGAPMTFSYAFLLSQ